MSTNSIFKENEEIIQQTHKDIDTGYKTAIEHYALQKEAFIKEYQLQNNKDIQKFFDNINESMNKEFSLYTKESEEVTKLDNIIEENAKIIYSNITSNQFEKLNDAFVVRLNNIAKVDKNEKELRINNFYKNISSALNELFDSQIYYSIIQKQSKMLKNVKDSTIIDQIIGKLRYALLEQLVNNLLLSEKVTQHSEFGNVLKALQSGKLFNENASFQSIKGLFKEELLAKATAKALKRYGTKVKQAGSYINVEKQDIKYDIVLFSNTNTQKIDERNIKKMFMNIPDDEFSIIEQDKVPVFYGMQSKSWGVPWDVNSYKKRLNTYNISLGHAEKFRPKGQDAYYWHKGVSNAMLNAIAIIGNRQTLYSTGNNIYFTADLLTQFRDNNYVMAYEKTNDEPISSNEVLMRKHYDMLKKI